MRPTDLTLWYDFINNPGHEPVDGRGPTLLNGRQSLVIDTTSNYWGDVAMFAGESRFPGSYHNVNWNDKAEDLLDPEWVNTGMLPPEAGFIDPDGGSGAWKLAVDATLGYHLTTWTHDGEPYPDPTGSGRTSEMSSWWIKKGNARYIAFSVEDPPGAGQIILFDFDTGDWVINGEYYIYPSYSGELGATGFYDNGDGWYRINLGAPWGTSTPLKMVLAFANGPALGDLSFQGDGSYCYVWRPMMGFALYDRWMGVDYHQGVRRGTLEHYTNYIINARLEGASDGIPPTSSTWQIVWTVVQTGLSSGTSVAALDSSSPNPWMLDKDAPQLAIQCQGTAETYYFSLDGDYPMSVTSFVWMTVSIKIDAIVTAGTQPVLAMVGFTGAEFPDGSTKTLADAVDGIVSITFKMGITIGFFHFGLGAGDNPDTADFTWTKPMLNRGKQRDPYMGDAGVEWTYQLNEIERRKEIPLEDMGGIFAGPAATNIVPENQRVETGTSWVEEEATWTELRELYASGGAGFATDNSIYLLNGAQNQGTMLVGAVCSNIVFEPGIRYTLAFNVGYVFGNVYSDYIRINILNMGSLDLEVVVLLDDPVPSVVLQGADVENVRLTQVLNPWGRTLVEITFTSDLVDTVADLRIRTTTDPAAAGNDLVDPDSWGSSFWWSPPVIEKGFEFTGQNYTTTLAPVTRDGDTPRSIDLSWLNRIRGALGIAFKSPSLLRDRYTVFSIDDGTSANRISLEIIDGVLHYRGVKNGLGQWNILTSVVADTNYKVAMQYEENAAHLFVSGTFIGSDTECEIPLGLIALRLGSNWNEENQLNSTIGEVQGYRDTLTLIELRTLSTGQIPDR